jgi:hypothetical protein
MSRLALFACLAALACAPASTPRPLARGTFYYPSGLVYSGLRAGSPPDGFLYVANANFDRRYDTGTLAAVRLGSVAGGQGLPAIETTDANTYFGEIADLGSDFKQISIQNFAGEMSGFALTDADGLPMVRLFIPTRSEGDLLEIVDARGSDLTCFTGGTNCINGALSLTALEGVGNGKPRAPEPSGVSVSADGQLFVTHLKAADSPPKSNQLQETFLVKTDARLPDRAADQPVFKRDDFFSLGFVAFGGGPSLSSVAVGARVAYLSSRSFGSSGAMVFLFDRKLNRFSDALLELTYRTLEARGIALGLDPSSQLERRLYVAARVPDSLVVASIADPTGDLPGLTVTRAIPLPEAPNQLAVIPRQGRGDLVVATSSTAGVVSIYDDDLGRLAAQITGVGSQPFGLAVQKMVNARKMTEAARLFVSNFEDGRIGVIDVPDLGRPNEAWLIGYLGKAL